MRWMQPAFVKPVAFLSRGGQMAFGKSSRAWVIVRFLCLALLALQLCACAARADVLREDNDSIARDLKIPMYRWTNPGAHPRGVVVTLHGFAMHGGVYDKLARELALQGFIVYAPDLRGYGRWCQKDRNPPVDYRASERDVVCLAQALHKQYPTLPVFYLGESMGAGLAIRLASRHPDLVSGLILSSPALKHYAVYLLPRMLEDCMLVTANPRREVDLVPYIKEAASEDPRISKEILDDPMVRKELDLGDILKSSNTIHGTLAYVSGIPAKTPVLVLQGKLDKTVKAKAVLSMLARLKSQDQTVRWFPERGHVLLETAYLQPALLETIEGWLNRHVDTTYESANASPQTVVNMN